MAVAVGHPCPPSASASPAPGRPALIRATEVTMSAWFAVSLLACPRPAPPAAFAPTPLQTEAFARAFDAHRDRPRMLVLLSAG
jgi:hypothetical protein